MVENAMAAAVLQNLSKEFNKPKLYEVTITENIQPDIVGFILATKKKLFCMTLEELYSLFPQQSFLGVKLNNSVGPEAVHRISPFTPDENLKALVSKYLAKRENTGEKPVMVSNTQSEVCGYDSETDSCEEVEEEEEEEEEPTAGGDFAPANNMAREKHVAFEKTETVTDRNPARLFKKPRSFPPAVQPAKRPRSILTQKGKRRATADVTHPNATKPGKLIRMQSVHVNNHTGEHQPLLPSAGNSAVTDILSSAAVQADIIPNSE